jgi:hypothetical protein
MTLSAPSGSPRPLIGALHPPGMRPARHEPQAAFYFNTQVEAITWAKSQGHSPHVARLRHLNDKKIPDHWRPV